MYNFFSNMSDGIYIQCLGYMMKICDQFALIQRHIDIYESDEEDNIVLALSPYLIKEDRVKKWEGGIHKIYSNNKKKLRNNRHIYECSKDALKILKVYGHFSNYESDIDISFFQKDRIIFWTISHENYCFIDKNIYSKMRKELKIEEL